MFNIALGFLEIDYNEFLRSPSVSFHSQPSHMVHGGTFIEFEYNIKFILLIDPFTTTLKECANILRLSALVLGIDAAPTNKNNILSSVFPT